MSNFTIQKIKEVGEKLKAAGWTHCGRVEEGGNRFGELYTRGPDWSKEKIYLNFHTVGGFVSE